MREKLKILRDKEQKVLKEKKTREIELKARAEKLNQKWVERHEKKKDLERVLLQERHQLEKKIDDKMRKTNQKHKEILAQSTRRPTVQVSQIARRNSGEVNSELQTKIQHKMERNLQNHEHHRDQIVSSTRQHIETVQRKHSTSLKFEEKRKEDKLRHLVAKSLESDRRAQKEKLSQTSADIMRNSITKGLDRCFNRICKLEKGTKERTRNLETKGRNRERHSNQLQHASEQTRKEQIKKNELRKALHAERYIQTIKLKVTST